MKRIILASGSEARKNIVSSLGIPFEIMPANIDEKSIINPDSAKRAELIAIAKAEKVANSIDEAIIISADTFCIYKSGKTLEKPEGLADAKEMLLLQSGSEDSILSGFCYIDKYINFRFSDTSVTTVKFRHFTEQEIDLYIQNMPVLTWSGAFYPGLPYGASLVQEIKGSLTGFLYGLPTEILISRLAKSGIGLSPKQ